MRKRKDVVLNKKIDQLIAATETLHVAVANLLDSIENMVALVGNKTGEDDSDEYDCLEAVEYDDEIH